MGKGMLDRVANAIYQAQVGQARENVCKLHFDCGNMPDLFQRLASESETAQILIFSSFLEDKVLSLIKLRLFHLRLCESRGCNFRQQRSARHVWQ